MKAEASVYFIGAGPGALDLLTVRAERIIREAGLILYADSLVNPEIATLARPGAGVIGSARMSLEEIIDTMVEAARAGQTVARVHSGDPSVYGTIREQMIGLAAAGISYAVVPGVSSIFGAAAALEVELTVPEVTQTVIISRRAGRTPVPEAESLKSLAGHRATLVLYLSAGMIEKVVRELVEGGYPIDTPAAIVYRVTWPEQQIVRGTLGDLAAAARAVGIRRQALILVGEALAAAESEATASRLYAAGFTHGYRPARVDAEA